MLPLLFLLINDNKLTLKNLSICRNIFCPPVHWVISEGGFANHNPRRASTRGKHKTFFRKRQTFSVCLLNSVIDSVSFSSSKPLWWDILISVMSSVPEKHRVNYVVEMWDVRCWFMFWKLARSGLQPAALYREYRETPDLVHQRLIVITW